MRHNSENAFPISKFTDCGLSHGRGCEDEIRVGRREFPFLSKNEKKNEKLNLAKWFTLKPQINSQLLVCH
jgi:hypothetical protein